MLSYVRLYPLMNQTLVSQDILNTIKNIHLFLNYIGQVVVVALRIAGKDGV